MTTLTDVLREQAHVLGEARRAWYIKHVLSRWMMLSHIAAQMPLSVLKFIAKVFQVGK